VTDKQELRYAVGVDFGGTSVKLALVDDRGHIEARRKLGTRNLPTRDAWLDAVAAEINALVASVPAARAAFSGVGVGVPGFVDYERGFIHELTNVPGWVGVHLSDLLSPKLGVRVRVENDVNAMALGECTFGAGRTYQHAVFVTLGTGVGGGLLINNKLYRGAHSMAGEIGHVSIDMNGVVSPQGRGGLEQYIGNRKLIERAVKFLDEGRSSLIEKLCKGDRSAITMEVVQEAATAGDELALGIYDFMTDCLATAFASVTYLLQPQAFIVGGGVSLAGKIVFDPLRRHLKERLSPHFAERVAVKPAELGNDAGVIGCATLAMMA